MMDKAKNKKGFTLLEVVVSVALLVTLSAGFMTIIVSTNGTQQRAREYNTLSTLFSKKIDIGTETVTDITEVTEGTTIAVILTPTTVNATDEVATMNMQQHKVSTEDGRTLNKIRGAKYNAGAMYYYGS